MNTVRLIRQLRRAIGLEPAGFSDFVLPAAGMLAIGALAGAGIALLFAPTTGRKLRQDMEQRFSDLRSRLLLAQGENKEPGTHRNNVAERPGLVSHLTTAHE